MVRNEFVRQDFHVLYVEEKIQDHGKNWLKNVQRMEDTKFLKHH
jgi:hypothetical protein